ncbi:MAG TPA: hypothetical protein VLA19_30275 [Herpetosiphonaceae bacterium]|nr:hypothetical protein [Herpetosiphonaceae bacterium]
MSDAQDVSTAAVPEDVPDWLRRDFIDNPAFLEIARRADDDIRAGRLYTHEQILRELEIKDE